MFQVSHSRSVKAAVARVTAVSVAMQEPEKKAIYHASFQFQRQVRFAVTAMWALFGRAYLLRVATHRRQRNACHVGFRIWRSRPRKSRAIAPRRLGLPRPARGLRKSAAACQALA